MAEGTRAHLYISGRVQRVAFRYATQRQAERHGLAGWVRNLADGRVEAVFEGEPASVTAMVEWCRQGPTGARVDHVDVGWEQPTGQHQGFQITF